MQKVIYFLHIPKTAGTTLTSYLDKNFEQEQILPDKLWHTLLEKDSILEIDSNIALIRGHFGVSLYKFYPNIQFKTITLLRDPIKRVVSMYNHFIDDKIYWNNQLENIDHESIEELLQIPKFEKCFSNGCTRHLSVSINLRNMNRDQLKPENYAYIFDPDFLQPRESMKVLFSKAEQELEKSYFTGIQEYFAESLNLLSYKTGWTPMRNNIRLMSLPQKIQYSDLAANSKKKLIELNQYDQKLYDFALTKFIYEYELMKEDLYADYYDNSLTDKPKNEQIFQMLMKRNIQ